MSQKDLLVMLPAYNEAACIGKFIDSLAQQNIFDIADILVINDGSTDETSKISKSKGVRVVSHIYNLGYGCALQTGYKFAVRHNYKYVIQIDSDGQHDACNIKSIYEKLTSPDNPPDIVIGSRFQKGSKSFRISWAKKIIIHFFRMLIRVSTHQSILDPTSGLQGLDRKAFLYYSFYNHFEYDYPDANMIIQMLLNDFKIEEISSVMHLRETGTSMHSGIIKPILYIFKMLLSTISVIAREKNQIRKSRKKK